MVTLSHSLALDEPQDIFDISRGDENTVNAIGQKHFFRIVHGNFYLTKDLAHVHFYNNDNPGVGAFFPHQPVRKRPQGLKFQES